MYLDMALLAGCALFFSCVAGRVEKSWISGPIIFILFGFLIGPLGLGWLNFEAKAETFKFLAELTLALVLFSDAASADLKILRSESNIPVRMLLIGLPLTLLFGFGTGLAFFSELSLVEVALLATILAPTDAALGQAVLKNKSVPANIRQGLNDGICVPILFALIAIAAEGAEYSFQNHLVLTLLIEELGIGLLVGVVIVVLAVCMIHYARSRDWLTNTWIQIPVIALAITCFATAQYLGGSGFIAAFCGGLLFGHLLKDQRKELLLAAEGTGDAFSLIIWVLFGSVVVGPVLTNMTWSIAGYALLSLSVARMLPIFISLSGSGLSTEGKWFLGWFGPRGLASIVFAIIIIDMNLPHGKTIAATVGLTILLSIVLHGITATPWANRWTTHRENKNRY